MGVILVGSDRSIVIDAQASEDTVSASILCDHSDGAVDRILRSLDVSLFSEDLHGTALNVAHSKDRFHKLGSLRSYQSAKAQDLTFL